MNAYINKLLGNRFAYFSILSFALFVDILLTWYGITYGNSTHYLNEGDSISGWIITNFGWTGVAAVYMILMLGFMYFLKISNIKSRWVQYVMLMICVVHLLAPINNVIWIFQ